MIAHLAAQSSTQPLFTLLAMIAHSTVQSSTRELFIMLFCSLTLQQYLIQRVLFTNWDAIFAIIATNGQLKFNFFRPLAADIATDAF